MATLETLIQGWLSGSDHGEFTHLQAHPMTHFSDPGFSHATKQLLFNMLDLRDNFKLDMSTQDVSLAPNTQAQDLSAGQALAIRAQMHPQSTITGVGCYRVGVYAHAGILVNGGAYSGLTPFNYNRLIQRRDLAGGQYIKGSAGGLPNSQVTEFYKPNWVADDDKIRALAWSKSINVVSHASRTEVHYADLRTVYTNDTSLFSNDEISDNVIYMYKIARRIWAKYSGRREPKAKLYALIERDINEACSNAFSIDNIVVVSKVYQTAADANLGYAVTVNLDIQGDFPFRQANFDVVVSRSAA
jgi:hypothetical protein